MTTTFYEIPLVSAPQSFTISLAGTTYNMQLMFHEANAGAAGEPIGADSSNVSIVTDTNDLDGWALDISDSTNVPIVCGIPLIPGIDLLYQYAYLGFGGSLVVSVDGDPNGVPNFVGLGTTSHLYFALGLTGVGA